MYQASHKSQSKKPTGLKNSQLAPDSDVSAPQKAILPRPDKASPVQRREQAAQFGHNLANIPISSPETIQRHSDPTGFPPHYIQAAENVKGMSFDGYSLHQNSKLPEKCGALALKRGKEIHTAPGQLGTLAHELGHGGQENQLKNDHQHTVVQNGYKINNNQALERKADSDGAKIEKEKNRLESQDHMQQKVMPRQQQQQRHQTDYQNPSSRQTSLQPKQSGALQAKSDDLWMQRREWASQFGHNMVNIPISSPETIQRRESNKQVQRRHNKETAQRLPETEDQETEERLATIFANLNNKSCEDLIDEIRNSPLNEREKLSVLRDETKIDDIKTHFSQDEALAIIGTLQEGSYKWKAPSQNAFFMKMYLKESGMSDTGLEDLTELEQIRATMNCWEIILYSLFSLNRLSEKEIYDMMYEEIARGRPLNEPEVWRKLGFDASRSIQAGENPPAGKLIYYVPNNKDQSYPDHVALSIGNGNVVSLWDRPNTQGFAQVINYTQFGAEFDLFSGNSPF